MAEAQEQSDKGMAALKTSMFQWKADHLSAAGYFEKSAELYKQVDELKSALLMMVHAAESHEASGATGSAALAKTKAAQIAKEQGDETRSKQLLMESADCWGVYGDLVKYAETLAKLAKEVQTHFMLL
jgi:hypothetical protein